MRESRYRSVAKAISWRLIALVITMSIVYRITDKGLLALEVGVLDSLIKILVYYVHERGWGRFPLGQIDHPLADLKFRAGIGAEDKKIIRAKLEELGYIVAS